MNRADPPFVATWILEHLTPGRCDEGLSGDLLEQFRSRCSDRACGWYWRQVIAAVFSGWSEEILNKRSAIIFATAWSILSPAWFVFSWRAEVNTRAFGMMWQMDWPWSTICSIALSMSTSLAFIWAGMALYLILRMGAAGRFGIGALVRSLLLALPMFVAISAVPYTLMMMFHPDHGQGVDLRTLTPVSAIADLRTWAMIERMFNLPILLYGLWKGTRLFVKAPTGISG